MYLLTTPVAREPQPDSVQCLSSVCNDHSFPAFPASLAHSLSHRAIFSFTSLGLERREMPAYSHSLGGPCKGWVFSKLASAGEEAMTDILRLC